MIIPGRNHNSAIILAFLLLVTIGTLHSQSQGAPQIIDRIPAQPWPLYDMRSPIGRVGATEPQFYRFGRPKRIEFAASLLKFQNGEVIRQPLPRTAGTFEFDTQGRVTAKGSWSDGSTITLQYEYDTAGHVLKERTARDGEQVGLGTRFEYCPKPHGVRIESFQLQTGNRVGTETQFFDGENYLLEEVIERNNSWISYTYEYNKSHNVTRIARFSKPHRRRSVSEPELEEFWEYKYDFNGNVVMWTSAVVLEPPKSPFSISYQYDESGNISGATYGEGTAALSTRWVYTFDKKGNWIVQTEIPIEGLREGGRSGYEVSRTITYCE